MMKASLLPALKEAPETVTTTLGDYFSDARFRRQAADLYEQSLVLAKDPQRKLPFQQVKNRHFEVIPVSGKPFSEFKSYFGKFADSHWSGDLLERDGNIAELKTALLSKNTVIVLLDVPVIDPLQHRSFLTSLESLSQKTDVVAVHFGRPDQLLQLPSGVIQVHAYERNKWTENLAAQLLFGAIAPRGVLDPPLPGYPKQLAGWEPIRMKFAQPEEAGIAAEKLVGLDAIAANAVADGVTPGCQIAVVKSGKLIYSKAFGHHSNAAAAPPVQTDDLYDLASITKVAATTLAAMKLYENDQLNLTQRIRKYVEIEGYSQVGLITIHKLMTHQSGLQPHLPIFKYIFPKELEGQANPYFTTTPQPGFSRQVAGHLYFKDVCWDSIRQEIFSLRLPSRARYRYSDLNFWLLQQVVENISGQPLDQYVSQNIYEPLGLRHMTFQPAGKFPMAQIVPTQYDEKWRGQLVQGYVHDEVAALMGGVSGNAGLFSNAEDLAVLFQMLVNGGVYGGMRLFEPETVQLFTSTKYSKNRGLGFDKPRGSDDNSAYAAGAPAAAFGHTGFTGTCVWADPQNELVFVFLANRICPDVKNRRLFEQKTRHRLHQVVYDAIGTLRPGLPELTEVE